MPAPIPRDIQVGPIAPLVFLVGTLLLTVAVVAYGLYRYRRQADPMLLLCVVGAGIASFYEPIVDELGRVYFVEQGVPALYVLLDRGMPYFNPLAYASYIGVTTYIAYRVFVRGTSRGAVFGLWALYAVVITLFETPPIVAGIYVYYSGQPLNFWGYPLWWAFVNPLTALVAATVLTLLHERGYLEKGPARLRVIVIVAVAPGISNGVTAAPMWLALGDATMATAAKYLAACLTLALSLGTVWIVSVLVTNKPTADTAQGVDTQSSKLKAQSRIDMSADWPLDAFDTKNSAFGLTSQYRATAAESE